jgi:outer membrane protein
MPLLVVLFLLTAQCVLAQAPPTALSLPEAERIALDRNPRIRAASSNADAADAVATGARAVWSPNVVGNVTAVGSQTGAIIGAGGLNSPSLHSRAAGGVWLSQLVADFGQTSNRIEAAKLLAESEEQNVRGVRIGVLLDVRSAFYDALLAEATAQVAKETLETRGVRLRHISALADNELRSTLDVRFAEVAVSEAELLVTTAANRRRQALASLAAAMGVDLAEDVTLERPAFSTPLDQPAQTYFAQALSNRPDLAALRLRHEALEHTALSEHHLSRPVVTADAAMGGNPLREDGMRASYGAAGVNVSIPLFNGKRFSSRQAEADARARAASEQLDALAIDVQQQIVSSWFQADTAWRQIELTQKLFDQSAEALRLAQTRYDLGLSSIVELNQAQLARTTAEIGLATARYEYEIARAILEFRIGSAP